MSFPSLVVIITGGSSGIGASTVQKFLSENWQVVIADRNIVDAEKLASPATQSGQIALAKQVDVADEQSVEDLVKWTVDKLGRIDAAVHAAGIGGPTMPFHEVSEKAWQQVVDIDLTGTFYFNKALVEYWRTTQPRLLRDDREYGLERVYQRGALVNVASVNGTYVSPYMGAYVSAKHGVLGVTKSIALENGEFGIRANSVAPGCTFTPIMSATPDFDFEKVKIYLAQQAIQRFAHPDEIAAAIYYLASDEASFVTGTNMALDAGWSSH